MRIVVTLLGPDRPGIIETFSKLVAEQGGRWCESRVLQAEGQFGGVFMAEVDDERAPTLESQLRNRFDEHLTVALARGIPTPEAAPINALKIRLFCGDRPGVLHEFSEVCVARDINILELETNLSPAPMSGLMIFEIEAVCDVPTSCDRGELASAMEAIGDDVLVEFTDRNLKKRFAHLF
ncbi:MAG: ACT domain-containing protein [Xanthomonadales bacterium]|nr:ACT domain-containing protein [Xanthomonadales bacterium]